MAVSLEITIEVIVTCDDCGNSETINSDENSVEAAALEFADHECGYCNGEEV